MTNRASSASRGRIIAYWVTTVLVAFQLGSGGAGDILNTTRRRGHDAPGLPVLLLRDPRRLEGTRRGGGARPALSQAQGVGLRQHGVRLDGSGRLPPSGE